MKPVYIIWLLACFLITFSTQPALACEHLQAKVDRYTQLKRGGGSAKQMNRWQAQRKIYAERYRECLRTQPSMHRATGKKTKRKKPDIQKVRKADTDHPVVLQLLTTCNFWIKTYNRHPSPDNKTYRDTACRALDDAQRSPPAVAAHQRPQRSLQECIKPGNLLDDDVRECMAGTREPDWH